MCRHDAVHISGACVIDYEEEWNAGIDLQKLQSYDDLPMFLNARMVAGILGVSPGSAYELMHDEKFPSLRIGNRWVVPKEHFITWVEANLGK